MIILITGASHTGKTMLAQKMLEKYGYPYLSIDHLKMGLIRSGNTDLTPENDDALTEYLWPIVREMVKTAVENEQNLIVEGCYIPFDWRQHFDEQYLAHIRFICLAMTAEYIENHFDEIISHESEVETRLVDADCTIDGLAADNKRYVDGFQKARERVVIIDGDYEETIEALLQEGDDHFIEQKTCVMKDLQQMVDAEENRSESSYLEQKWMEIEDLLNDLSREPYIDDQIEIEMIWIISEELINGGHLQTETWEIREQIIQKITDNEYYDQFGVCDPMMDLIRELPQDREEKLKTAEIMWNGSGFMKKDSAKLFRELGEEGRYIQYLETHLGDEPEQYMEVVRFYEKSDPGKSEQIAELAREKCRRTYRTDLTEVYIFLVRRAYEAGDTDRLCSLFDSARRRQTVNSSRLKEACPEAAQAAADAEEAKRKRKRNEKTVNELLFFDSKPDAQALYEAFREAVLEKVPNARIEVKKTQISFFNRRMFAAVSFAPVRKAKDRPKSFLTITFGLAYRKESDRIDAAVEAYPNRWTHHVMIGSVEEVDEELLSWIVEAAEFAKNKKR